MHPRVSGKGSKKLNVAVFSGMTAVMLLVGTLSYQGVVAVQVATTARGHSRDILFASEAIRSDLDEAESGQRGYLLTGEERYLQPYQEASARLVGELAQLKSEASGDVRQVEAVRRLTDVTRKKLDELADTIALRRQGDVNGALKIVATYRGQAFMDEARDRIAEIKAREQQQLDGALGQFEKIMRTLIVTICSSVLVAISAMLMTMLWLNRELSRRTRIEQQLAAIIATQHRVGTSGLEPERIMALVVEDLIGLTGATGAVVELLEADEMVYRSASGPAGTKVGLRAKAKGSFSGLCVTLKETLLCEDADTDERVDRAACRAEGVRSMIVAPLVHGGPPIGVLKAFSDQPNAFAGGDVETLKLMTGLLGASLAHAAEFEAKKHAEALASDASRMKSEFLANMSHEIRTPLNGILGMAGLLGPTLSNPTQRDHFDSMERSAEALLAIVNDVLDFSKIEAGKLDLEVTDFDLDQVISDLGKTTSLAARRKGLDFAVHISTPVATQFRSDPGRIRQVLGNLLGNAVKFTSKGSVKLVITPLSETDRQTTLRFDVIDTGIGIPVPMMPRLFSPFTQADASTTRRFGGTGLGLSISKQLIVLMGGEIGVETREQMGSTFWFTLPLEKGRDRSQSPRSKLLVGRHPMLASRRILVAEDNAINQKIAIALLAKFGCHSFAVSTGHEVLTALRESPFDMVLMDCQMPEMDGYEATAAIRAAAGEPWQSIPIIAMTANALKGDRERCLSVGMTDYVSKPVNATLLAEALLRSLDQVAPRPLQHGNDVPSERAAVPVLDVQVLEGIRAIATDGNDALLQELLASFVGTTPARLKALRIAADAGDRQRLGREAHALRGGAGSLGLLRFAAVCQQLEDAAAEVATDVLAGLLIQVDESFIEAQVALVAFGQAASNAQSA